MAEPDSTQPPDYVLSELTDLLDAIRDRLGAEVTDETLNAIWHRVSGDFTAAELGARFVELLGEHPDLLETIVRMMSRFLQEGRLAEIAVARAYTNAQRVMREM